MTHRIPSPRIPRIRPSNFPRVSPQKSPQFSTPVGWPFLWYAKGMKITVELPDDVAKHADPGREALEALAIEGYRSGTLTHYQAGQLLGLTRFEFDRFLKDRNIYEHAYDVEDLDRDMATHRKLEAKGALRRP
jgi:predicted HTH domain antitoxin